MSAIMDQDLISIKQAAKLIPTRPHIATIWRWIEHGCRGHKLQSWLVGGQRFTSRDAIEDFFAKLNPETAQTPIPTSTPKKRQREIDRAEKDLAEMGL